MPKKAPGIRAISRSGGNLLRAKHAEVVPKHRVVSPWTEDSSHCQPKACMISKTSSTHPPPWSSLEPHTVQPSKSPPFTQSILHAQFCLPLTDLCRKTRDFSEPSAFLFMCTALLLHHNHYLRPLRPAQVWHSPLPSSFHVLKSAVISQALICFWIDSSLQSFSFSTIEDMLCSSACKDTWNQLRISAVPRTVLYNMS